MPILGIIASSFRSAAGPVGAYDALATVTPNGSVSSVSFVGIPSTYKHLQIRMIVQSTYTGASTSYMYPIRCNGDAGNNYSMHSIRGNGSSVSASGSGSRDNMFAGDFPTANVSNTFGTIIIDILDYQNTSKYKTFRTLEGYDVNGSGQVNYTSGSWQSTAAITSITLPDAYLNWSAGSSFALYGIK
jgi:hypothetical protein